MRLLVFAVLCALASDAHAQVPGLPAPIPPLVAPEPRDEPTRPLVLDPALASKLLREAKRVYLSRDGVDQSRLTELSAAITTWGRYRIARTPRAADAEFVVGAVRAGSVSVAPGEPGQSTTYEEPAVSVRKGDTTLWFGHGPSVSSIVQQLKRLVDDPHRR
jgi:hypothetical protein